MTRINVSVTRVTVTTIMAKTFKLLSLPTELRLMIWNETFQPRILHITSEKTTLYRPVTQQSSDDSDEVIHAIRHTHTRFKAREKPPIALQICHESRALALKHYTPSFHSTISPLAVPGNMISPLPEMNQTAIYFNPELDTVHILEDFGGAIYDLSKRTNQATTLSIKVLAVQIPGHFSRTEAIRYLSRHLPSFGRLETIVLVDFGWDAESTLEDILIKTRDSLRLARKCAEWKVPVVKAMNSRAFESHL
jgi:hypothetical protein